MKNYVSRNVNAFKFFTIFSETIFWGPIVITSIINLGHMPLEEVYFMESICMALLLILNIPAGILADIFGRKLVLMIGSLALIASAIAFSQMHDVDSAWVSNILWAIGTGFVSGADSALLFDFLRSNNRESDYGKIIGIASSYRLALQAVGSLAAGFLATISLRLPLYASIPTLVIPIIAILFMKEERVNKNSEWKAPSFSSILKSSISILRKKEVRVMIVFATLLGAISKVWFFTYNPYFELVHIPLSQYGVIFFLCSMVACVMSRYSSKLENRIGEKNTLILMMLCITIPILLMGMFPIYAFAFLPLIQNVVRGTMRPIVEQYLNRHIGEGERTTVLSVYSTTVCLAGVIALAIFGIIIKYATLPSALIILGIISLFWGILSLRQYNRFAVSV